MKASNTIWLLLISFHNCFASSHNLNKDKWVASRAVANILVDSLAIKSPTVDVISCGGENINDDKILGASFKHGAVIQVFKCGSYSTLGLKGPSVLTFDSLKSFREISENILWQRQRRQRHSHIVHIPNMASSDLEKIPFDGFKIDYVNFLVNENEKSIDLYSSFMFTARACRANQFVRINQFDKSTMKWNHSDFYPDKYRDLHGCHLTVGFFRSPDFATKEISETLAQFRNFEIDFVKYTEERDRMTLGQCDFSAQFCPADYLPVKQEFMSSVPFFFAVNDFYVPPGEPYSELERMFLMFDFEVWMAIGVTILSVLCSTLLLRLLSLPLQKLIFGHNVTSPTLNFVSTFLTGGQRQMPENSFARFLLLLFIMWSLIIRTCHQSMLFTYLQADLRKPMVKSFEELVERNFTFYGRVPIEEYGGFEERGKNVNFRYCDASRNSGPCLEIISEPANKGFMISYRHAITQIRYRYRSGYPSFRFMNESLILIYFGLAFKLASPFYGSFNDKIDQMIAHGLIAKWTKKYTNPEGLQANWGGPQVLTFENLSIGFQVCCIPLTLSVIAFVGEILTSWIKRLWLTLSRSLVASTVIRAFYRHYNNI